MFFYDEYFAVLDIPADFYLETVRKVFKDYDLPEGRITHRGNPVDFAAVRDCGLFTVEGEHDDITGRGQTRVAHDILSSIPAHRRKHLLQPGVGHYGIFSGSRFRNYIGPAIREFILNQDNRAASAA